MTVAHHRRAAFALAGLLALATCAYALSTVRDLGSATAFLDDWVYNAVIGGAAVLALWRAAVQREERLPWLLIGLGLASWLAGDVWWVLHSDGTAVPIPSLGDVLYLGMYPPMSIAIV